MRDEAQLAFVRGWAEGAAAAAGQRCFMATWRRGDATGVAFQRGDGPAVIGASAPEAAHAFAEALQDDHPQLCGIVGARDACEAFAGRWPTPEGKAFRLRHHMRDHVLRTLAMPASAPGTLRRAGVGDHEWLIAMQRAFAAEVRVRTSEATLTAQVGERLAAGRYRIWNDGDDVAFAGFGLAGDGAARIAPVYTPPAFRARGYASSLVAAICAELQDAGRQVFLVTDVDNPTSNALYARLGFVALGDCYAFELEGMR